MVSTSGLPSEAALDAWERTLNSNRSLLSAAWKFKRWTSDAISRLHVGFDGDRFVFPVRDDGNALVGVVRYAPAALRDNGQPKAKADAGSKRELYPAPETLEGDTCWICEGESDAVAATALGLPAVGVPGTGGWRKEWAKRFAEQHVIVVMDCDPSGRKAAARIAADLAGVAATVRILDLDPERDDGYDLGDFLAVVKDPGDFVERRLLLLDMVSELELYEPVPDGDGPGRRFMAVPGDPHVIQPRRWAWRGWASLGSLALFNGDEGVGKGVFLCERIARWTHGEIEGDLKGTPATVLWIGTEDGWGDTVAPRLLAAGADLGRVLNLTAREAGDLLELKRDAAELRALIDKHGVAVTAFEALLDHLPEGTDDWKGSQVRRALAPLTSVARDTGTLVIGTGHMNRARSGGYRARYYGSGQFPAVARSGLFVMQHPDNDGRRVVGRGKGNYGAPPAMLTYRIRDEIVPNESTGVAVETEKAYEVEPDPELTQERVFGLEASSRSREGEVNSFLRDLLKDGPMAAGDVEDRAEASGLPWRTVEENKATAGVESIPRREGGSITAWEWRLREEQA